MKRLLLLLAAALLFAGGASALQQAPYDAHTRVLVSDGAGGLAFVPRATYRYAGLAFTPVATPTDVIQIQGSATKTLRITRIGIGGVATAQGNMPVQLVRRSTAGTLGSAVLTAVTAAKTDTSDPAATGVVSTVGTANYTTLGTAVATLGASRLNMPAVGTGAQPQRVVFVFFTAPLGRRGASDWLGINLNGAAVPSGGVIDYEIEIQEDAS
jgi:hypothetical protein